MALCGNWTELTPFYCLIIHGIMGRLKMHDLKMQYWKMTDNILANSEQNYGVWKMQYWKMTDHVN